MERTTDRTGIVRDMATAVADRTHSISSDQPPHEPGAFRAWKLRRQSVPLSERTAIVGGGGINESLLDADELAAFDRDAMDALRLDGV